MLAMSRPNQIAEALLNMIAGAAAPENSPLLQSSKSRLRNSAYGPDQEAPWRGQDCDSIAAP
jgi:hypothetical protein